MTGAADIVDALVGPGNMSGGGMIPQIITKLMAVAGQITNPASAAAKIEIVAKAFGVVSTFAGVMKDVLSLSASKGATGIPRAMADRVKELVIPFTRTDVLTVGLRPRVSKNFIG